jgi:hypothetical protein
VGRTTVAVEATARRLRDAGFPAGDVVVMGPDPSDGQHQRWLCADTAGMPSFGIQGVVLDNNDIRAHGKDERLPIQSFDTGSCSSIAITKP